MPRSKRYQTRTAMQLWIATSIAFAVSAQSSGPTGPPRTERHEVTETFFGQSVTDPYRWLENWHDSKAGQWLKAQDNYARSALAGIPGRQQFLARVKALDTAATRVRDAQVWGGKIFYLKTEVGSDNLKLYVQDRADSRERLLLNPQPLTKNGVHYSIDYFQPSLDGALVAYGISPGGSENSVLHVLETATGKQRSDAIDRVQRVRLLSRRRNWSR